MTLVVALADICKSFVGASFGPASLVLHRRHGRSRLSAPAGFVTKRRRFETALSACSSRVRHRPQAARGFERLAPVSRPPILFLNGPVHVALMRGRWPFTL